MIWQQYEKYAEDALSRPTLVAIIKMREKLMGSAAGLRHTFFLLFCPFRISAYPNSIVSFFEEPVPDEALIFCFKNSSAGLRHTFFLLFLSLSD
jgi:hypothetical protein